MEHVVVFKNSYTQYDVMHYFTQSLSAALEKQGVKTTLVDFSKATRREFMHSLYATPPDCTLGFNGPHPLENGTFLANELEIPHIAWLVDAAHYFADMVPCPYHVLITPDQTSCDLLKTWGAAHSYFLPHAFEASLASSPQKERPYPISFCGSLIDYLDIEEKWREKWSTDVLKKLLEVVEQVLAQNSLSYQTAFENSILPLIPEANITDKILLAQELDQYLRGKDRLELLKALKGLPVHIFGNSLSKRSWSHFLDIEKGSYTLHKGLPFPEINTVMSNSQILLNSSPMFKTGGHERIFYGLGLGAAVLTNATPWLSTHFVINEEVLTYQPTQWHQAHSLIEELLADPSRLKKIATQGQAKVLAEHTWEMRALQLIPLAEKAIDEISQY